MDEGLGRDMVADAVGGMLRFKGSGGAMIVFTLGRRPIVTLRRPGHHDSSGRYGCVLGDWCAISVFGES